LHQTGRDCLASGCDLLALQWSLSSRRAPPPWLSYSGPLGLTFSLSCLGGFLPRESEEKLQAQYSCKVSNPRNWGLAGGLYQTANATWVELNFSVRRLFSSQLLSPSLLKQPMERKVSCQAIRVLWPGQLPSDT
jgi:hypothetical protein